MGGDEHPWTHMRQRLEFLEQHVTKLRRQVYQLTQEQMLEDLANGTPLSHLEQQDTHDAETPGIPPTKETPSTHDWMDSCSPQQRLREQYDPAVPATRCTSPATTTPRNHKDTNITVFERQMTYTTPTPDHASHKTRESVNSLQSPLPTPDRTHNKTSTDATNPYRKKPPIYIIPQSETLAEDPNNAIHQNLPCFMFNNSNACSNAHCRFVHE
ncbi:hypothetical protein HDU98_001948, partial [Podochytrium sp. JEL0797]